MISFLSLLSLVLLVLLINANQKLSEAKLRIILLKHQCREKEDTKKRLKEVRS